MQSIQFRTYSFFITFSPKPVSQPKSKFYLLLVNQQTLRPSQRPRRVMSGRRTWRPSEESSLHPSEYMLPSNIVVEPQSASELALQELLSGPATGSAVHSEPPESPFQYDKYRPVSELRLQARALADSKLSERLVEESPYDPLSPRESSPRLAANVGEQPQRDYLNIIGRYGERLSSAEHPPVTAVSRSGADHKRWSPRQPPALHGVAASGSYRQAPAPAHSTATHRPVPPSTVKPFNAAENPIFAFLRRPKARASMQGGDDIAAQLRRAVGAGGQPTRSPRMLMPYVKGSSATPVTASIGRPPSRLRQGLTEPPRLRPTGSRRPASAATAPSASERVAVNRRPASARPFGPSAASAASQRPLSRPQSARPQSAEASTDHLEPPPAAGRAAASRLDAKHPAAAALMVGARPLGEAEIAAIRHREACMSSIAMQLQTVRRVRGQAVRLSGRVCAVFQWRMAQCLAALRDATLEVAEAAERWRTSSEAVGQRLVRRGSALRHVPEPMVYEGSNYLLKMLTDVAPLPLPGGTDPLFLRWFGTDVKWWHPNGGRHCLPLRSHFGTRAEPPPPFPTEMLAPSSYENDTGYLERLAAAEKVVGRPTPTWTSHEPCTPCPPLTTHGLDPTRPDSTRLDSTRLDSTRRDGPCSGDARPHARSGRRRSRVALHPRQEEEGALVQDCRRLARDPRQVERGHRRRCRRLRRGREHPRRLQGHALQSAHRRLNRLPHADDHLPADEEPAWRGRGCHPVHQQAHWHAVHTGGPPQP